MFARYKQGVHGTALRELLHAPAALEVNMIDVQCNNDKASEAGHKKGHHARTHPSRRNRAVNSVIRSTLKSGIFAAVSIDTAHPHTRTPCAKFGVYAMLVH